MPLDEALLLFSGWRNEGTRLIIHPSSSRSFGTAPNSTVQAADASENEWTKNDTPEKKSGMVRFGSGDSLGRIRSGSISSPKNLYFCVKPS